jgi:hypothetical protein
MNTFTIIAGQGVKAMAANLRRAFMDGYCNVDDLENLTLAATQEAEWVRAHFRISLQPIPRD